jgi:hypothetical protein
MRKRIKVTGFSDWDSMFYNNLLSIPVLLTFSFVIEDWGSNNLDRNLYVPTVLLPSGRFSHVYTDAAHPTHVVCSSLPSHSRARPQLASHILLRGASA